MREEAGKDQPVLPIQQNLQSMRESKRKAGSKRTDVCV